MESDQSRQQVYVVITLPPSDDPSFGKTVTIHTYNDDSGSGFPQTQQTHHQQEPNTPNQTPFHPPLSSSSQIQLSPRRLFLGTPKKLMGGFLGISLLALMIYSSLFQNASQELRDSSEDDEKPLSFIFPLYHKMGIGENLQKDLELKLGRFIDVDKENLVASVNEQIGTHKGKKLVSSKAAAAGSSTISPISGNVFPDGLYFTYMHVGSPPRPYFLDIDTGSDLTWIQCDAPCTSCAKGPNALYKPTKRNIVPYKDALCLQLNENGRYCGTCQQCDYEIEYADHSSSMGVLARDEVHLKIANGSSTKLDAVFGCAYDQQGQLLNTLSKTDGILGLSRAKVSLPSQFASRGIIKNVVGHCLTTDAAGGGYMFLGDDFVPQWGMAWVPMLNSPSMDLYHSEIVKLHYGNSLLSLGGQDSRVGRIVFDSGSSYTYFTKQAYSELVASLKDITTLELIQDTSDATLPICWRANFPVRAVKDISPFFKTLSLQIGSKWWIISKKFQIRPEGYLIISNRGNVCLGILDGSEVHDGATFILGDISLRGKLVVYDNENQKIGWAPSDCATPRRYESLPSVEG
ncbi:Eukaryotic aspartyl protease family protein putative isoform 1 [Tripterygium wilfordii]|uniref:Eukaryotic aspartyl protease family protein putative isoform 1 n=1 Tax=Tripterygium wilfordii TaxID=458696 RepID=A0A7J7CIW2_TRIWF|nr:aspartyl protease APCB1 [Tripterygium wilfordii]KAF5733997.1 Eukaryotic aspartyl protease family protein putative isoform 1 [Tripterygium wilfordii]